MLLTGTACDGLGGRTRNRWPRGSARRTAATTADSRRRLRDSTATSRAPPLRPCRPWRCPFMASDQGSVPSEAPVRAIGPSTGLSVGCGSNADAAGRDGGWCRPLRSTPPAPAPMPAQRAMPPCVTGSADRPLGPTRRPLGRGRALTLGLTRAVRACSSTCSGWCSGPLPRGPARVALAGRPHRLDAAADPPGRPRPGRARRPGVSSSRAGSCCSGTRFDPDGLSCTGSSATTTTATS